VTLPNKLTLARLATAPVAFGCLWSRRPALLLAALILYLLAMLTDAVDGWIARRTGQTSDFGALADPLADKVLVIGALVAFLRVPQIDVPDWAVFLIIARELIVGTLRALAAVSGKVIKAGTAGKWSMLAQSVCVLFLLALLAAAANGIPVDTRLLGLSGHLVVLCLAASWGSGALYIYRARALLRRSWEGPGERP
jgi:CDP-diacylglycerol--glycerol-3-phosphate 3-phosphatidyltransferase